MTEALIGATIGSLSVLSMTLIVAMLGLREQLSDEQLARQQAEERARRAEAMAATLTGFRQELRIVHETVGALAVAVQPRPASFGVWPPSHRFIRFNINELD